MNKIGCVIAVVYLVVGIGVICGIEHLMDKILACFLWRDDDGDKEI